MNVLSPEKLVGRDSVLKAPLQPDCKISNYRLINLAKLQPAIYRAKVAGQWLPHESGREQSGALPSV